MKNVNTMTSFLALTLEFTAVTYAQADTSGHPNIVLLISYDDDYEHFEFMSSEIGNSLRIPPKSREVRNSIRIQEKYRRGH